MISWIARLLRSREGILLLLLGLSAASTWVFLELGDEVMEDESLPFDRQILVAFRAPDNPGELRGPEWLQRVTRDVTALGSGAVLTLVTIGVGGFFILRRQWVALTMVLFASVGGSLLVDGLKSLYGRSRPDVIPHLMTEASQSFPSGHSTMSALVYLTLAVVLAEFQEKRGLRVYILAYAAVLVGLIGLSRIILGVHYPSDVAAGWTLGLAWASLIWLVIRWLKYRKPDITEERQGDQL